MREPVGGADNERIKGVATVKAGYASGSGIGIARALGEVTWPTVLVIAPCRSAVINLVVVGCGVWRCGSRIFGRRHGSVVGFVGRRRSDADPELDLMSESAAESVGNRGPQMALDFVLDKAARHG